MTFIKKNYKILIIVLTIVIFILFLLSIKTNPKVLKCSIDKDLVSGIHLTDNIKIYLNKGKIKNIKQDKSIELKDDYLKYDTYKSIMEMHLKSSYEYLDKKNYDVKTNNNIVSVKANIDTKGLILNNLIVEQSNKDNKYDLKINTENSFENAERKIMIDEEYKYNSLKKYMEESGYKCK